MGRPSLVAFALRRLLWLPVVLLFVMLVTFALVHGAGGSPFRLEFGGVPYSLRLQLEDHYALNEPWYVEFWTYLRHIVTFDFGPSLVDRYQTVDAVVEQGVPVTGELVLLACLWAVPVGLGLGLAAGFRRDSRLDRSLSAISTAMLAVPVFLVANAFFEVLVSEWGVVPFGWDDPRSKATASLALALAPAGYIARLTRAAVAETSQSDYVRTARAKGLGERRIATVHVLRNAVAPILGAVVPTLGLLITGTFFVESRFGIPGAGTYFVTATKTRDYPMVMGLTVVLATVLLVALLIADVAAAALDPRVRDRERR